jgi:hypothetical protein
MRKYTGFVTFADLKGFLLGWQKNLPEEVKT